MQAGNSYAVSSATTLVLEGAGGIGTDTVSASVSYALANGSEIEVLRTGNDKGKTAINLTGNDFGQTIIGNAGVNVIEGKGGADIMTGRAGKDVFVLGDSAVSSPANIDTITDYERGEIVDISQVLSVAAGTNVVADGYLRVTTSGLIQVDLNGGGNDWVTLSNINGNGAVTLRYLSGGAMTNVAVSRIAANTVLASAVAAAGMMAVPAAAENHGAKEPALLGAPEIGGSTLGLIAGEQGPLALAGEGPQAVNSLFAMDSAGLAGPFGRDGWHASAPAATESAAGALTPLLGGTDAPAQADAMAFALPALAVAMPAPAMLQLPESAAATAEVGRILVDALGSGHAGSVDALLDVLPGLSHPMAAGAVTDGVAVASLSWEAALGPAPALLLETMAMHPDAVATC